jgi:hypothetical protein
MIFEFNITINGEVVETRYQAEQDSFNIALKDTAAYVNETFATEDRDVSISFIRMVVE